MIASFHDNETLKIWEGEFSRRLPTQIQTVARRKLRMLNNAHRIDDLRIPPQNRLEKLTGNRDGQWSIRISESVLSGTTGRPAVLKYVTIIEVTP